MRNLGNGWRSQRKLEKNVVNGREQNMAGLGWGCGTEHKLTLTGFCSFRNNDWGRCGELKINLKGRPDWPVKWTNHIIKYFKLK
jgi:hypothetical protein